VSGPRALILRAPGTNCEAETERALRWAGAETRHESLRGLLERPRVLEDAAILVVAGGFSYGDDVAAGRVFGLELRRHLARELFAFVEGGGRVLGICNGFQVLLEAGLFGAGEITTGRIPGPGRARDIALYANASNHYECRWVTLESQACACPWLVPGELMPCPVAHAEGRFVVRDPATLERLVQRGQIALRYAPPPDAAGSDPGTAPGYPANPNGSVHDVAGICDSSGRVLGLMPHPERNLTPWNHPLWTRMGARSEGEGLNFFRRMVEAASGALV